MAVRPLVDRAPSRSGESGAGPRPRAGLRRPPAAQAALVNPGRFFCGARQGGRRERYDEHEDNARPAAGTRRAQGWHRSLRLGSGAAKARPRARSGRDANASCRGGMTLSVSLTMTLMLSWCHHWSPLVTFLGTARGFNVIRVDLTPARPFFPPLCPPVDEKKELDSYSGTWPIAVL